MQQIKYDNPDFKTAVELLDTGNVQALQHWVDIRPNLLNEVAFENAEYFGEYFAKPRLLWFIAENPIRNNSMPINAVDTAKTIIELAKKHQVADLQELLNYTLVLIASGRVARERGNQIDLCRTLIDAGANPNSGMRASLANRELEAAKTLLSQGAELTLSVASSFGLEDKVNKLKVGATEQEMQESLSLAVINGQARSARILMDNGSDPSLFNAEGLHAHSTPLHQAICFGYFDVVCTLITRGADLRIRDKLFDGDALQWAEHHNQTEILEFLKDAEIMMKAVTAIKHGNVCDLMQWLQDNSNRVNDTIGDNPRSLLHYATDWPGKLPHVGKTIELLAAAGADVNARYKGNDTNHTETPLHWAASCDDLEAAEALINAGADLNPVGGCIANAPPIQLSVIFGNWQVANKLLESGAKIALHIAAGLGSIDLVKCFFNDDGNFDSKFDSMPNYDSHAAPQEEIDIGLWHACLAGRKEVVGFLVEHGANVNYKTPLSSTPLDDAIGNGHKDIAEYLKSQGAKSFLKLS